MDQRYAASTILLISVLLLFASCKKHHDEDPLPTRLFEVGFNASTIDINNIDSVTISFTLAGRSAVIKKMQKAGNAYRIDNADFGSEAINTQISVYTPKDTNVPGTKPVRVFAYGVTGTTGFTINGPSDKKGDVWKPRFIFTDDIRHVSLTVAEDQEDPYFSLKVDHSQNWVAAHFQKAVFAADSTYIDNALWETTSTDSIFPEGINAIVNTTNFAPYAARIVNTNWAKVDIYLLLINNDAAKTVILHSTYTRRY